MLEAKLSGDADDLMLASMYAPDRARLHEWISEEKTAEVALPGPHQAIAKPFSFTEFHPPSYVSSGGTGPLDTKVQVIVSQHFKIFSSIQKALIKPQKTIEKATRESVDVVSPEVKAIEPETAQPTSSPESIVYHAKQGVHIPISVSQEQLELFESPRMEKQSHKPEIGDPLSGFKLRPARELENVLPDASVKNSIEQHELPPSETMAKLLVNQGNTRDAITIFEQLILANPEKSAYFTAQIKKIKQPN
jgi:hypothetical protein